MSATSSVVTVRPSCRHTEGIEDADDGSTSATIARRAPAWIVWRGTTRQALYTPPTPRDETVELRRVGVGGVYMNSQLTHDDCRRIR